MERTYLGDSVYCDFDGFNLRLFLNNGDEDHNIIFLEPSVVNSLLDYLKVITENQRVS